MPIWAKILACLALYGLGGLSAQAGQWALTTACGLGLALIALTFKEYE